MNKIQTLAKYLDVKEDELSGGYDENFFEIGSEEYTVLTEDEANSEAGRRILDSLWGFNSDFIIAHSDVLDYNSASKQIIKAIAEQYKSGNEVMKKLIDDLDEFVQHAINEDGRGYLIAQYDSEELKEGDYYIYRTN